MRRHVTMLLVVKLVALSVLWALWFSPAHRSIVGSQALERRLAAERPQRAARPAAAALMTQQKDTHD